MLIRRDVIEGLWRSVTGAESATRPAVLVFLGTLPFLVMVVVAGVDAFAGPQVGFLPLLSVGPALAAVTLRPGHTALTGGLAIVLCLALSMHDELAGSRRGIIALATIAGVTMAGAVASAGRHRRERDKFRPGDQILFYTDGISEARDKSGAFYTLSDCGRLLHGLSPDVALDHLRDDVVRYVGHELLDDAAMLLISRHPGNPRPGGEQAGAGASLLRSTSAPGS